MDKEEAAPPLVVGGGDESDDVELVLYKVPECYVYLIPPRKTAGSYRADEWDVNKWAWEGQLKVVSKGEECIIRLEDKSTGELYARAFLRKEDPHPVEPVIDSSRYFVLRIEENVGGRLRHAFIGLGFRERTEAYDFQAALHDHMKVMKLLIVLCGISYLFYANESSRYLDKKKTAEEMEQHFQHTSGLDYSLKKGETLVLQIKNPIPGRGFKSQFFEQGLNNLSLEEKAGSKEPILSIRPPPPPPGPLSPVRAMAITPTNSPPKLNLDTSTTTKEEGKVLQSQGKMESIQENFDDDFGDFQAAG
ncbi:unnamed protein product [Linum tenue]|uniref:NECAP PHear domain-containing protein n=1 Tax=Linum tenue TaxID=586396 RepID=A0AAV0RIE4_9ROSI|nr:unnamed protein product [Linum tenue]